MALGGSRGDGGGEISSGNSPCQIHRPPPPSSCRSARSWAASRSMPSRGGACSAISAPSFTPTVPLPAVPQPLSSLDPNRPVPRRRRPPSRAGTAASNHLPRGGRNRGLVPFRPYPRGGRSARGRISFRLIARRILSHRLRSETSSMSSIPKHSTQRFRVGMVMLAICLSLPVADHVRKQVGTELSAFFLTSGGRELSEMAELGYNARRDLLSKT